MEFYYKNAFFSTLFILIIVLPIYFLYQHKKYKNSVDNRNRISKAIPLLLIIYLAAVIAVLIIPYWHFWFLSEGKIYFRIVISHEREVNLIPFKTLFEQINGILYGDFGVPYFSFYNILANLCIFIPFPILLKLTNKRIPLPITVLITFAFSFVCEFVQYFIGRTSDIDDLILNTLGSIIGCVIYRIAERIIKTCTIKKNMKTD